MAKITIATECIVPDDVLAGNRVYCDGLGLPSLGSKPVADSLAVVGGGKSILDNVQEIRDFNGEVWAINGAFQWCKENGIDATFYSVDASESVGMDCIGADRAVLADNLHPSVYDELNGADIEIVPMQETATHAGAASTAPMIAATRGHKRITFFGCECSFVGTTHAYEDTDNGKIWVQCGGREYVTNPQLIIQAEFIAELAKALPITVVGDGLLPTLIEHGNYDVTHVSREIHNALDAA